MNFNTYDEIVSFSTEDQDLPFGRGHPSAYHQIRMRSMTTMMTTLILNRYRRPRPRRQTSRDTATGLLVQVVHRGGAAAVVGDVAAAVGAVAAAAAGRGPQRWRQTGQTRGPVDGRRLRGRALPCARGCSWLRRWLPRPCLGPLAVLGVVGRA